MTLYPRDTASASGRKYRSCGPLSKLYQVSHDVCVCVITCVLAR
jgi:hypothetical protein